MNTFQLAQVLTKDPFTKGRFAGVYACDQLSSIEISKYPKSFVVYTDPMELPGTHWIAIYFNEQTKGEFFDSYGKHREHTTKNFQKHLTMSLKFTRTEKACLSSHNCLPWQIKRCSSLPGRWH